MKTTHDVEAILKKLWRIYNHDLQVMFTAIEKSIETDDMTMGEKKQLTRLKNIIDEKRI